MQPHRHDRRRGQAVRLRDLAPGAEARIVGYAPAHRSYRSRLLSMGLTKGTVIVVRNIAPLGDPVHISVRDFDLSLRVGEADVLILERLERCTVVSKGKERCVSEEF